MLYAYASAFITARLPYCFPIPVPCFNYSRSPLDGNAVASIIRKTVRRAVIAAGTNFFRLVNY